MKLNKMISSLLNANDFISFLNKSFRVNVLDYSVENFSAQGFGSTMWAVIAKVKIVNDSTLFHQHETKTIELVVKAPVTNTVLASIFQPTESCVKENGFYLEVIPSLLQLQRERGFAENELIDIFIHCYGARLSQNPESKIADGDALLVLENLKLKGYRNGNLHVGFNKFDSLKILEKMAEFHALPIALRLLKKDVFETRVRPYLKPIDLYVNYDSENVITKSINASLDRIHNFDTVLRAKVSEQLVECSEWRKNTSIQADTPYTTINHHDLWINNILFTCDSKGKISKIKFCDYQLTSYCSFAMDLIFFLYTSVGTHVLHENFEHFIRAYHSHFYKTLEHLGCPLNDYTYEKCRDEIDRMAKYELEHIILMLKVILADKDKCPKKDDLDFYFVLKDDHLIEAFYERLHGTFRHFHRKGFV